MHFELVPRLESCLRRCGWVALMVLALGAPEVAAAPRQAALVLDANTGAVLHNREADSPRHPASLTKMMTLYLVFEQLERGRLTMSSRINVSASAAASAPSKLGLEAGSTILLGDLVKAIIVKSANDMAAAVAEHIGGSEDKFAVLMTEKARALGMRGTTFKNASGLPHDEQVTTARDMLTLALALQDHFPSYYPLFASRTFAYDGNSHRSHNTLLGSFEGTDGIKTGYTRASGFNLVSSVRRGQKHIVAAVFGGTSASARNTQMRTLLTLALTKASTSKTRRPEPQIARAKPLAEPKVRIAEAPAPALILAPEPVKRPAPIMAEKASASAAPDVAATQPEPVAPTPAPPAIEIARVRSVQITPLQRSAPAEPAVVASVPLTEPPPAATAAPVASAPVALQQPPQARAPQVALAPAPVTTATPPSTATLAPVPRVPVVQAPPVQPARGAAPSTLQQQAAALDGTSTPKAAPPPVQFAQANAAASFRLAGPVTAPQGGVQIQIGAYASQADAERQLATTRERVGGLLNSYQAVALPVQTSGRALYRARYAGFDAQTAATVCTELRRRQIDCLVTRD